MSSLEVIRIDFSLNFNELLDSLKSEIERVETDWIWVIDKNDRIFPEAEGIIAAQLKRFRPDCLHFPAQAIDIKTSTRDLQLEEFIAPKERKLTAGNANFVINYPRPNWPAIFNKVYRRTVFVNTLAAIKPGQISHPDFDSLFNFIAFDLIETYRSIDRPLMIHYSNKGLLNYDVARYMQHFDDYINGRQSVWSKPKRELMSRIRDAVALRLVWNTVGRLPKYNWQMNPERFPKVLKLSPLADLLTHYIDLDQISKFDDILRCLDQKSASQNLAHAESKIKRIAMYFPSLEYGGAEKVLLEHARILHERGFEIILITNRNPTQEYVCPQYITRVNLDITGLTLAEVLAQFGRALKEFKVDLVINHNAYSQTIIYFLLTTRLINIPWVQWLHSNSLRPLDFEFNLVNDYYVKSCAYVSNYVCLTPFDVFVQKAYGISGAVCIPNPVIMKPTRAKPRSAVARNPRLLWVGRLDDMTKQISELPLILEALVKVLPNLHLDIVGPKGPFTPENFESKFYRRGLESNVTFHGPKTPLELPEYYRKSDLFIFTSITEGSPNVLLEASAYGLPIVMYELPWLPIAQNNLGCIQVPQRDYEAFSQSVVKLVRDSVAYTASSQAALAKVEQLKQTDITQMLLDLVHGQISAPAFTAKERTDYAKIIARFIFYNTSRISDIKLQRQRQFDAKHISILGNQAQAIEGLIYSMGNVELDKLRLQRQFSPLRKLRSRLGRIKREILAKIAN